MKETVQYILKNKTTGLYLKDKIGEDFTTNKTKAKVWPENSKPDEEYWYDLMKTNNYIVVKRTETTSIEYEEVTLNE